MKVPAINNYHKETAELINPNPVVAFRIKLMINK